jgi:hypothetical protein
MPAVAEGQGPLSLRQIYEFDVRGYITIPGFLGREMVAMLNRVIDGHHREHGIDPSLFPFMHLDRVFWDLMVHPTVLDIAKYWCGDHFRVDHVYGFQRPPAGTPGENVDEDLHGGPRANQGSFHYQWFGGKSRVGLLVFTYVLEPVGPGDGGLVMVPGSHKGSMALEGREVWDLLKHSHDNALCEQPVLNPGDLLIFTESVIHGTRRWQDPRRRRRNLYYKYCPGHLCWRDYGQWAAGLYGQAQSEIEKSLLRPPFVARYDEDHVQMSPVNNWRNPTRTRP